MMSTNYSRRSILFTQQLSLSSIICYGNKKLTTYDDTTIPTRDSSIDSWPSKILARFSLMRIGTQSLSKKLSVTCYVIICCTVDLRLGLVTSCHIRFQKNNIVLIAWRNHTVTNHKLLASRSHYIARESTGIKLRNFSIFPFQSQRSCIEGFSELCFRQVKRVSLWRGPQHSGRYVRCWFRMSQPLASCFPTHTFVNSSVRLPLFTIGKGRHAVEWRKRGTRKNKRHCKRWGLEHNGTNDIWSWNNIRKCGDGEPFKSDKF